MRDFLDNLIDRHVDAAPQIMPRLPSIFEPEVSHGGLNVTVPDNSVPELEETDVLPAAQVTIPTASPTAVKSVQPKATPAPTVPAREERPSVKEGLNKPAYSLTPRETPTLPSPSQGRGEEGVRGLNQGLLKPSATLIAPVVPSVAGPELSTSQPEPVINVTIGRIEVRATVSQQKPTPKPESRTPVMGLEEYLRRRSGGHDR